MRIAPFVPGVVRRTPTRAQGTTTAHDVSSDSENARDSTGAGTPDFVAGLSTGALECDRWCGFLHHGSLHLARFGDVLHRVCDRLGFAPGANRGLDTLAQPSVHAPSGPHAHRRLLRIASGGGHAFRCACSGWCRATRSEISSTYCWSSRWSCSSLDCSQDGGQWSSVVTSEPATAAAGGGSSEPPSSSSARQLPHRDIV